MADDLEITFNTHRFNAALSIWNEKSKKSNEEILQKEARLFTQEVVRMTPPHKPGRNTSAAGNYSSTLAKKSGEQTLETDIQRLFIPVFTYKKEIATLNPNPKPGGPELIYRTVTHGKNRGVKDLAAHHRRARNRKGRVPKNVRPVEAQQADIRRYLRAQKKKVGALVGGWERAAQKLGLKLPAWISRHSSPGGIEVDFSDSSLRIKIKNAVRYASDQAGLERRITNALEARERKLIAQVNHRLKENSPFR